MKSQIRFVRVFLVLICIGDGFIPKGFTLQHLMPIKILYLILLGILRKFAAFSQCECVPYFYYFYLQQFYLQCSCHTYFFTISLFITYVMCPLNSSKILSRKYRDQAKLKSNSTQVLNTLAFHFQLRTATSQFSNGVQLAHQLNWLIGYQHRISQLA